MSVVPAVAGEARRFLTDLPKAELHVHLEGTLEAEDLLRFATRNGVDVPWASPEEVRAAYEFTGLEHFLAVYYHGCRVLRTRDDFAELTRAHLGRSAAQGVRRAEVFFGPQTFLDAGVPVADQLDGVLDGIAQAREEWGVDTALLVTAQRHRTQDAALDLLDVVSPWAGSITGFGLGGAERGNPPEKFARYYARARDRGFRTTIHAGEEGSPDDVRRALDVCGVERIDHGVAAARDPALLARLRADAVPLTVCPISNLRLKVTASLADHPVRTLVDAGVVVTVNSDDPSYFRGGVADNYVALHEQTGFTLAELTDLARNSFRASFASAEQVAEGLAAVDDHAARVTPGP